MRAVWAQRAKEGDMCAVRAFPARKGYRGPAVMHSCIKQRLLIICSPKSGAELQRSEEHHRNRLLLFDCCEIYRMLVGRESCSDCRHTSMARPAARRQPCTAASQRHLLAAHGRAKVACQALPSLTSLLGDLLTGSEANRR